MSTYASHDVPVIVRGEGPWVWDSRGRRYLDGLSGLFVVQAGHGRRELAEAAAAQAEQLAYFPLWSYAHPNAIELAERLADAGAGRHQPGLLHHRPAARRWSRPGSWPASTSGPPASPGATRCCPAPSPTTGRPWAPCPSPGCRSSRSRSSRWFRGLFGSPTPTSTGPPSTATTRWRSAGGPPTTSSGTS